MYTPKINSTASETRPDAAKRLRFVLIKQVQRMGEGQSIPVQAVQKIIFVPLKLASTALEIFFINADMSFDAVP